jgi:hypothetical protein
MRRPGGVTLIAVLLGISAVLLLIAAIAILSAPAPTREGTAAETQVVLGVSGKALAVVLLVGFLISSGLCQGLLKMRNWARVGTMIVTGLAAIGAALALVQAISIRYRGGVVASVVEIAIYLVIFFYLMRQAPAFRVERRETRLAA